MLPVKGNFTLGFILNFQYIILSTVVSYGLLIFFLFYFILFSQWQGPDLYFPFPVFVPLCQPTTELQTLVLLVRNLQCAFVLYYEWLIWQV